MKMNLWKPLLILTTGLFLSTAVVAQVPDSVKTVTDTIQDSPELFLSDLEKFVAARERQAQTAPMKEAHQQELWDALQKRKKNLIDAMSPQQQTDLRHLEERYRKTTKSVTKG